MPSNGGVSEEMLKINPSIFREYDIRGIAGQDLSSEFALQLGRAYGEFLIDFSNNKNPSELTVAIGRDCRLSGEEYSTALGQGIMEMGINIVYLGVCPTPLTYFSIFHHELDGGIMVTGSHNPSNYNGFKVGAGTSTLHGEDIQTLRKLMEKGQRLNNQKGKSKTLDIIPEYIDYVSKISLKMKKKKVVLDAGNGTAGNVAPELFHALGAEVVPLFCELDGNFPNHHPDPTVHENLKDLQRAVIDSGADFGVAFDGDADRIGIVDEKGRAMFGDELMVIFSRAVLEENPGATIISEVKSSHRLYQDIQNKGGNGIMWKTGHSLIKSKMKESGALLAGEMSGHVFFKDRYFGYDDAIYAAVRLLEISSNKGTPVSSWIEDLPKVVATPEIRVDCDESKKFELVSEAKKILKNEVKSYNDIDGIRIDFNSGWGLIRASNTQPVLVLRYEAENNQQLSELRSLVEGALQTAAEKLNTTVTIPT